MTRKALYATCTALAALAASSARAQTGYIGILGGDAIYKHSLANINELRGSGFNEVIVWSVEVGSTGDLNLNDDFPLTSAGAYSGNQTYPLFAADLATIKRGSVRRVTLSIGSSNVGDWQNVKALVDAQGTGPGSILYKDFAALKAALPVDAIDFDDENSYDASSTTRFAVMLGKLGYKVTINPYTNSNYWISLVAEINSKLPGTVDGVHLQTYNSAGFNSPCFTWNFGSVPVYGGVSDQPGVLPTLSPIQTKAAFQGWHTQCGVTGGWVWLFDQIAGTNQARKYAHAIIAGVDGKAK